MRYQIFTVAALALLLAGVTRTISAQSLADLARQEAERRKTVKDSGKVYTNSDLPNVPPATAAPSSSASAPASGDAAAAAASDATTEATDATDADGKDKDKGASGNKDQKYWSGRMKELQTQLDRDQAFADALQVQINAQITDFVNRDDPAQRAVIAQNQQKSEDELARLKLQIEVDKKAISDLEEEARHAAVPPGWLR